MTCVCSVCEVVYGVKEPLEGDRATHGYCEGCFDREIQKIEMLKGGGDKDDSYDRG